MTAVPGTGQRSDLSVLRGDPAAALAGRAYRLLAAEGFGPGVDPVELLVRGLQVSAGEARAVLDWLRERRLFGAHGSGQVSAPETAVLELLGDAGGGLERLIDQITRWRGSVADLAELVAAGLAGPEPERIEVLHFSDRARLRRWLDDRASLNTREAVMMYPSFPPSGVLRHSLEIDRELLGRGVEFRLLSSRTAARRPHVRSYLNDLHAAGAQIRVSDSVPLRMLVTDRMNVVTPEPDAALPGDVVLRGVVVARCFLAVFDCLWAAATDYAADVRVTAAGAAQGLGPVHISLLRALATGAKDEAVARALGCSDRTLRRLIAQTLDELGVRSRFAAGVRAAQLGLLD